MYVGGQAGWNGGASGASGGGHGGDATDIRSSSSAGLSSRLVTAGGGGGAGYELGCSVYYASNGGAGGGGQAQANQCPGTPGGPGKPGTGCTSCQYFANSAAQGGFATVGGQGASITLDLQAGALETGGTGALGSGGVGVTYSGRGKYTILRHQLYFHFSFNHEFNSCNTVYITEIELKCI